MCRIGKVKLGNSPTICAILSGRTRSKTLSSLQRMGIRLIEFRADQSRQLSVSAMKTELKRIKRSGFSVLLTIRIKWEGGARLIPEAERLASFRALLPFSDGVDVELNSRIVREVIRAAKKLGKTTVISFHDFKKTPPDSSLSEIFKRAKKMKADIVKVAALAKTKRDLARLMNFTANHRNDKIITVSMGKAGQTSRITFPYLGSLITYGAVSRKTAPGQLNIRALVSAIRFGPRS